MADIYDSVITSPTNVFATWNSLVPISTPLYDGALQSYGSSSGNRSAFSTIQIPTTGKWYIEILLTNAQYPQCGIAKITCTGSGSNANIYGYYENGTTAAPYALYDGSSQSAASSPGSATISSGFNVTTGNITRIYIDADNNQIWFGNNTNWATSDNNLGSTPTFGTSGVFNNSLDFSDGYFVFVSNGNGTDKWFLNAGQDSSFGGLKTSGSANATDGNGIGDFYYDPPTVSGTKALALCTSNIQSSLAIDPANDVLPEDYFKCVTYSGTGSANNINVEFTPDLVWIKCKDNTFDHMIFDSIRGVNKNIYSNGTSQEVTTNNSLTEFITTGNKGFQVVSDNGVNNSSYYYISWNWKSGGAPSGATSATGSAKRINSSGTQDDTSCDAIASAATSAGASNVITPTLMSINQKSGFSIISYAGTGSAATIPHGLNKAPEFVIIKNLNDSVSSKWAVFHKDSIASGVIYLDDAAASASGDTNVFNSLNASTISTNNIITLGDYNGSNGSSDNHIMYAFTSIEGYSAFGSYTGNGSTDGPFIYTGFKPALVLIKCISDATTTHTSWAMYDNAREPNNVMNKVLYANKTAAEGERGDGTTDATDIYIDFLSNGFKVRSTKEEINDDGETYIFMAFAEQPFKFSNAR